MLKTEDFWAAIIGLLALAGVWTAWDLHSPLAHMIALNAAGLHWGHWEDLVRFFQAHWISVGLQFPTFMVFLLIPAMIIGLDSDGFVIGFVVLFVLSLVVFIIAGWQGAAEFELEPPVVALLVGLVIANTVGTPAWIRPAARVEMYLKIGIVLLGATFPVSLLYSAGLPAMGQAAIGTIVTVGGIYFLGRRMGLSHSQSAVLGTGVGVCGVSAALAAGSSVKAPRGEVYQAISLVILFSLILVVGLPLLAQALGVTPGQGGAWIGSSELADAAGAAAAANLGHIIGHTATVIRGFTLTKVIGRDVWIGLWAFFWTLATAWVEGRQIHGDAQSAAVSWWERLPKFVVGFLVAAVVMSVLTIHLSPAIRTQVIAPLTGLRTWAFTLCFLSIGLHTKIRSFFAIERRVFLVFTLGVLGNLLLGYVLSTQVFGSVWAAL